MFQKLSITKNVCQNHGLGTPDEAFFQQYSKLLGQFGRLAECLWGVSGVLFGQTITTHFGTASPLSIIFIIQFFFLQLTLHFQSNPNISQTLAVKNLEIAIGGLGKLIFQKQIIFRKFYMVIEIENFVSLL